MMQAIAAAVRPCPVAARPAAAGSAARRSSRRAPSHVVRAQSDEERAAALKAALEQAQSNPEVRRATSGSRHCSVLCGESRRPVLRKMPLQRPSLPCRLRTFSPVFALRLLPLQVAAKMKQMEEAMANPAMQAQMSQMM